MTDISAMAVFQVSELTPLAVVYSPNQVSCAAIGRRIKTLKFGGLLFDYFMRVAAVIGW